MQNRRARTKGFTRTSSLITQRVRTASESRGFAQSRLLTHWAEVAGEEIAGICRPVEVTYGKGALGATLTLLTTGPHAPVLEMEKEKLRAKVNTVYGYNAISRIRITQTAPSGFAEGQAVFARKKQDSVPGGMDPEVTRKAASCTAPIADEGLRAALARLGENIFQKTKE